MQLKSELYKSNNRAYILYNLDKSILNSVYVLFVYIYTLIEILLPLYPFFLTFPFPFTFLLNLNAIEF